MKNLLWIPQITRNDKTETDPIRLQMVSIITCIFLVSGQCFLNDKQWYLIWSLTKISYQMAQSSLLSQNKQMEYKFTRWIVLRKWQNETTQFAFSIIPRHWDGVDSWNRSPWKTCICLSYTVRTIVRKLIGNMVQKYFSARNIFFPQEIFFSARNIFFSTRNIFFPQEIYFSPQEIYFFPQEIFFSARNIFFRKKYFSPQEIYFSPQEIFFLRKKYIFLRKKYIFFRKKYFFSARNIFFRKKYFPPQEIFLPKALYHMLSRSVSLSGARLVLGWSLEDAAMDFFDHLRSLGISEEEIRKMRDDFIFSAIHKKRVTKLTCQMYGGPEGTSLHKFFIALHKFWLVWKQGKSEGFESCDRPIVRKRPIWVKIGGVLSRVTLKFDGWPWKTIGHLSFAVSSFVQHFIAIGEFKLELQSGNAQFGSNSMIFFSRVTLQFDLWPWKTIAHLFYATSSFVRHFVAIGEFKLELQSRNAQFESKWTIFLLPRDLAIWLMSLKNNRAPFQCYFKRCASFRSHRWFQTGDTVRKRPIWVKIDNF